MTHHCHADTLPTFQRAAELAAHRASLARPVAVSDAEPLRIPEAKAMPTYRPRPKREQALGGGRPKSTVAKPSICRRRNTAGETVYASHVRCVGGAIVYIGRYMDLDQAMAACQAWIDSGVKPPPKTRGPKLGSKNRPGPYPLPPKPPRQRATTPTSMPLTASGAFAAAKPLPKPPRSKTALSSAERLQLIKDAWRRTA